jgi:hypothetical protein
MGLDMYLTRQHYVKNWDHDPVKKQVTLTVDGVDVPLHNVVNISEEVAYWRKANHIHQWFVANVQGDVDDCREYDVTVEQLAELVENCHLVLADHDLAEELLPTQDGFFFGGTEYDEWYFGSLRDTIEQLEPITEIEPRKELPDIYYEYRASW